MYISTGHIVQDVSADAGSVKHLLHTSYKSKRQFIRFTEFVNKHLEKDVGCDNKKNKYCRFSKLLYIY
jgi:hypothetical protein